MVINSTKGPTKRESTPEFYPCLPMQQGMLYHLVSDPCCGIDINQVVGHIPSHIDPSVFQEAWQQACNRHAVLRLAFSWKAGDSPKQILWPAATVKLKYLDWTGIPEDRLVGQFRSFLNSDRTQAVELSECPVWRIALIERGEFDFTFVFTGLHALMDGHSFNILLKDVFLFYDAIHAGKQLELADPPPYADFMQWYFDLDQAPAKAFWKEQFEGFSRTETLHLPPRPKSYNSELVRRYTRKITLSAKLSGELKRLAREQRVTLSIVTKAAWALLLSRFSRSDDIAFGEVHWGRRATIPRAVETVSLFMNTLPQRVSFQPEMTVGDLLSTLRDQRVASRPFEHTSLQDIQRWCGGNTGAPLVDTLFVFDQTSFETPLRQTGGRWADCRFENFERTSFPLMLNVHVEPTFELKLSFDEGIASKETAEQILQSIQAILLGFVDGADRSLSSLCVLSESERYLVVDEWNRTDVEMPADETISMQVSREMRLHPARAALVSEKQTLTYGQLDRQINQLANYVSRRVSSPNARVGICLDRTVDMVVALHATMRSGCAYVPLDPAFPLDRIRSMVEDSRPDVILTSEAYLEQFAGTKAKVITLDGVDRPLIELEADDGFESPSGPQDLAYVIYTSGSTGRPKGVMLSQRNLVNCFLGIDQVLDHPHDGVWLASTSISFDISVLELFYTLSRGFTVVLAGEPQGDALIEDASDRISELMKLNCVTHFQCTPSLMKILLANDSVERAMRSLDVLMLGGEPMSEALLHQLGDISGRRILNMYGPTETTIWSTWAEVDCSSHPIPIGRPIANTRVYVVDPNMELSPVGVPGELLIGGQGVAPGYFGQPGLTSERFINDRFSGDRNEKVYRTGDLVRYGADGVLEFLGRIDHQVKIRGHRIELGEISSSLRRLEFIRDAVVIARSDMGMELKLVAYVIPVGDERPRPEDLRSVLASTLPEYMIPHNYVVIDAFPLTPNGKIDVKTLARPGDESISKHSSYIAPRNETEEKLAKSWRDTLGVSRIGVQDNFFELGGDSVTVVQLCEAIRKSIGKALPAHAIYQYPTIEQLQNIVSEPAEAVEARWATVERLHEEAEGIPLIAIHGVENIFGELSKFMVPDRPVRVVTTRSGFDGRSRPYFPCQTVEEMAAYYLSEIRSFQPSGPYYLVGFCLGGLISLEVARLLQYAGEEVAFLGLINSVPEIQTGNAAVETGKICHEPTSPPGILADFDSESARPLGSWWSRFRQALYLRRNNALLNARCNLYPWLVRMGLPVKPETIAYEIGQYGWRMVKRYSPKPYSGNIDLFYGNHAPIDALDRWHRLADGRLESHPFPADHYGLMQDPVVQDLAMVINERIQSVDIRRSSDASRIRLKTSTIVQESKP